MGDSDPELGSHDSKISFYKWSRDENQFINGIGINYFHEKKKKKNAEEMELFSSSSEALETFEYAEFGIRF